MVKYACAHLGIMLLKNCRIVSSRGVTRGDILIEKGKIARIGANLTGEGINVKGAYVIPGLVDMHVHMRDFRESYKEDFYTGSSAAIAGGVTSFVDMPNSKPPVVDSAVFDERMKAAQKSIADYGIAFGVTEDNIEEAASSKAIICKIYMDGALGGISDETLERAAQRCRRIAVHAEDASLLQRGERPAEAEEMAVMKVSALAERLEKRVHICHISRAKSLKFLNRYTTCEVTPHHLLLTEEDLKEYESLAKVNPPLRTAKDAKALLIGLKTGRIAAIASDHAPHSAKEKDRDFDEAPAGIPNLDSMLRLFLTLVNRKVITLPELVAWMCENPARLLGLDDRGVIAPGKDADLVVLDMNKKGRIEADEFYSKAKYSPFEGWRVKGGVEKVILRESLIYEEEEIVGKKGYGKPLNC